MKVRGFRNAAGVSGQALVEFALVLPLVVVLLVSFFDGAIQFFARISVDRAIGCALAQACKKGPEAFRPGKMAASVASGAIGVEIEPSMVQTRIEPADRDGWYLVSVTVSFTKPCVSGLYFNMFDSLVQKVEQKRLYPREVVGR